MMDQAERIARLRLFRTAKIGPITFYKLLSRFGNAINVLDQLPNISPKTQIMPMGKAMAELETLEQFGGRMIVFSDDEYPEWLTTIEDAPPVLNIMGDASLLSKPSVAIVGARNASANAKRLTMQWASDLGKKGQVIVSGLARGIDTAAHDASLETGTIAVVAGGLDQIYPTENTRLFHDIAGKGCVVTEMPMGTKPTAHHFPRRNRIVSGLSKGTLVVEASMKSGSLITARLAGEQGREVFAIPGFPGDPRAAGPNYLIQNGAKLVQNADDILNELVAMNDKAIQPQTLFDMVNEDADMFDDAHIQDNTPDNIQEIILQNLSAAPIDVDEVSRACNISIQNIQTTLLELELSGIVTRHPGNRVSKVA